MVMAIVVVITMLANLPLGIALVLIGLALMTIGVTGILLEKETGINDTGINDTGINVIKANG